MKTLITLLVFLVLSANALAQQSEGSKYPCAEKAVNISFPSANEGKFRFKTHDESNAFGKTFAARQKPFNEAVYLEWQIGYDALVEDVRNKSKQTSLTNATFIGSTGKEKYPYELSEILFESIKCGLISTKQVETLLAEIESYKKFIDEKEIVVEKSVKLAMNGLDFKETNIKLPTLFLPQIDQTEIEVTIQKQQYASGIQPMIYFCIPFKSFANWKELDGKKSVKGNTLKYVIKKDNSDVVLNMFRVFGMASPRHKFDVEQILKTIKKLVQKD